MKRKSGNKKRAEGNSVTLGFTLWQVSNLWQRELRKKLFPLNLTHAQYLLLQSVYKLSEDKDVVITQIRLAQNTGSDKMMVSKVLRTLEGKKLLKRTGLKADNRAKKITLTAKGIALNEEARILVENFEKEFFVPAEKHEKALTKGLLKLLKSDPLGQ